MFANLSFRLALCFTLSAALAAACSSDDSVEPTLDGGDPGGGPDASIDGGAAPGDGDGDLDGGGDGDGDGDLDGGDGKEDGGDDLPEAGSLDGATPDGGVDGGDGDGGDGDGDGDGDAGSDAGADASTCGDASTEVCNAQDDDCDGLTDEGLLAMSADDTLSWDLPQGETMVTEQRGFSQLLARGNDGAWLLTKALAQADGLSALDVAALDANGAKVGDVQTGILPNSRVFMAASLEDYLAVMWRDTDDDGVSTAEDLADSATHLTLFQAGENNVLTELDSIELTGPSDISEIELQRTGTGELRILAVYGPWTDLATAALGPTVLHTVRLNTGVTPAELVSVGTTPLPANARPTVHVLKRPCAEGWIVGYWTNNGGNTAAERVAYFRAMTLDGVMDLSGDPLFRIDGHALQGVGVAPDRCGAGGTPILVLADTPDSGDDKDIDAYHLRFVHGTGALTQLATHQLPSFSGFTRIAYYGGRWYFTIRTFGTPLTGVYELDVVQASSRNIATPVEHGLLSGLTTVDVNMYFIPTQGILTVGEGMLVTFSNARPQTSPLGPETVAVTHRLACQ